MIAFRIDGEGSIPDALEAMIDTAAAFPGDYEIGPFSDRPLLETSTIFVSGADEVEAAEALASLMATRTIPFTAL